MNNIGFVISHKNGEKRRALLPEHIINIKNVSRLFVEEGYGESLRISDEEYKKCGVNIVSREEALSCDIIVDVKLGDADYLEYIGDGKTLIGWAHAVQNIDFTTKVIEKKHTVIAWEEIYEKGRYIFYRNREIAGEAAVMHAFRYCGKMPYDTKVAILGNGQTAKGALRVLHGLGAEVDVYGRKLENLFKEKMYEYDVIINCVMWDTNRTDRIIYKKDLAKFKKGTLIIDVSCDPNLEIETSHATTIDNPVYEVDGVIHYAVDNTPAMYPITVSKILSEKFWPFIDDIVEGKPNKLLKDAVVLEKGNIIYEDIKRFREMRGIL
jgi:N5-(carboxyethyl)ornithine synthase